MALHFSRKEYKERLRRAREQMVEQRLDGILLFRQESMYYLTGYDTLGYAYFQTMYLGADGKLTLVTRAPDIEQARQTSIVEDVRIWVDRAGANAGDDFRDMLESHGMRGKRIGIEYHAFGLTAYWGKLVDAALEGFCTLVDASDLVRLLRQVKSPAELAYVRKAGEIGDAMRDEATRLSVPGAFEGDIYGAMFNVNMQRDGDPPSNARWPMGSGETALLVRYHSGHRRIGANDQVTYEFSGAYRYYTACLMFSVLTGQVDPRHRDMYEACREALNACEEVLRPGNTLGDVWDAHEQTLTRAGYAGKFLNACGYGMGATFPPAWVDWPMIYRENPQVLEPGMVLFMHMILLDTEAGLAMHLGETAVVSPDGCEPVTHAPRELVVN
jgi:Xaa-Pro dipeptidase